MELNIGQDSAAGGESLRIEIDVTAEGDEVMRLLYVFLYVLAHLTQRHEAIFIISLDFI